MIDINKILSNTIAIGTIINVENYLAEVKVNNNSFKIHWLSKTGNLKSYIKPKVNEQVLLISPNKNLNNAIIIGSIFSEEEANSFDENTHTMKYKDNAEIRYNYETSTLEIKNISKLKINSNIEVEGNIKVEGDVIADEISLKNHTHIGNKGRNTSKAK